MRNNFLAEKLEDIRRLALRLRNHAGSTELETYSQMMVRAADDLERHANQIERTTQSAG